MNIQKIILVIVLSVFATGSALSQKKIGIFVHGFNGSSEKWLQESNVPQNWKTDGIIDDFIALDYKTEELATDQTQAILLNKFITKMNAIGSRTNDEWIIVGHSLGGIVGRLLYPELRKAGFNVIAVTSIGGPSQGAAATNVSISTINREIDRIKNNFQAASQYEWPFLSYLLGWQQTFSTLGNLIGTNSGDSQREKLDMIPVYLEKARNEAVGYANTIIEKKANEKIGVDGDLIQVINNFPKNNINLHPQNYLSIIGAEKDKAPIRMIDHIFNDEKTKDEVSNLDDLDAFNEDYMGRNQNHWDRVGNRWSWCAWFSKDCRRSRDTANRKEGYWKTARREISDLGKTWSTIINSYRIVQVTYREYIPPCINGDEFPRFNQPIQLNTENCSFNPNGEWVYIPGTVKVADKNDGVVNIHSALWTKGDPFIGDHNQYFDDVPADGGYNHFELRNHKRAYTLPGYFNKGDKNPSTERVETWIASGFRF